MANISHASVYSPLDHSKAEIRLIHLQPHSSGTEIACSLYVADLDDDASQYEALSYEWGAITTETESVLINEIPFAVRQNLYTALDHLRYPTEARILWVDAVCINQEDEKERNYQVTQMGAIYQHANRVVAWIGPALRPQPTSDMSTYKEDTLEAFRFAELLYGTSEHDRYRSMPGFWEVGRTGVSNAWCTSPRIKEEDRRWMTLNLVLERRYWGRLWIIQELVLASNILIQAGAATLKFVVLEYILKQMSLALDMYKQPRNKKDPIWIDPTSFESTTAFVIAQQRSQRYPVGYTEHSVFDLCYRYRDAACFDIRDKIFGLLGMSQDCCRKAIPVDYSVRPSQLAQLVVDHQLRCHDAHFMGGSNIDIHTVLSRHTAAIFTMFRGSEAPQWLPAESSEIWFSTAESWGDTHVAMLRAQLVGEIKSVSRTQARSRTLGSFVAGSAFLAGTFSSILTEVMLGDMVYKISSHHVMILRSSGDDKLLLVAMGAISPKFVTLEPPRAFDDLLCMDMRSLTEAWGKKEFRTTTLIGVFCRN